MMLNGFAAEGINIVLPAESIFHVGPLAITNSMILGGFGVLVMLGVLITAAVMLRRGVHNHFTGLVSWTVEGMYSIVFDIIPDKKVAKKIAPLALTIFFTVLFTYWCAVLPGVGTISIGGKELLRELPSDLNFTFAIAIIAMVTSQIFAIRAHGPIGNIKRYMKNPFKDPIGGFEGLLEFVGEFSRLIALALRLFGNAFAGAALLMIVGVLSGWVAGLSLPFVMIFELFIGFIQAYVFFMLTLIFTSLAIESHGDTNHAPSPAHASTESDHTT